MPRLFTGLELPPPLADELARLRGSLAGARWIEPEDFHITLRFIGDVGQVEANEIHLLLASVSRPACPVTIAGLDAFGGARPRAIIATVKPTPALLDLQAEQERLMRRLGHAAETRKFTPHVTIARLRQTSPIQVAHYLGAQGWLPSRTFTAAQFALFSARESVGGGPYVREAVYPLGAGERGQAAQA